MASQYEAEVALNSAIRANPAPWLGLMRARQQKLEDDARAEQHAQNLLTMRLRSEEGIAAIRQRSEEEIARNRLASEEKRTEIEQKGRIAAAEAAAKAYAERLSDKEKRDAVYKMINDGIEIDLKQPLDDQLVQGMKARAAGNYPKARGAVGIYKDYEDRLKTLDEKIATAEKADQSWVHDQATELAKVEGAKQFLNTAGLTKKELAAIGPNPTVDKILAADVMSDERRKQLATGLQDAMKSAYAAKAVGLLDSQFRRPTGELVNRLTRERQAEEQRFSAFRNTDPGRIALDQLSVERAAGPLSGIGGNAPGPAAAPAAAGPVAGPPAPLDKSVGASGEAYKKEKGITAPPPGTTPAPETPAPGTAAAPAPAPGAAAAAAEPERATGLIPWVGRMFTGDNAYQRAANEPENVAAREDVAQAGWYDFLHNFDPALSLFYRPAGGWDTSRPAVHHAALPLPGEVAATGPDLRGPSVSRPLPPANYLNMPPKDRIGQLYPGLRYNPATTPLPVAPTGRAAIRLPNPLNDRIVELFGVDAPDLLAEAGKLSQSNGISQEQQEATFKAAMGGDSGAQQQIRTVLDYMRQARRSPQTPLSDFDRGLYTPPTPAFNPDWEALSKQPVRW